MSAHLSASSRLVSQQWGYLPAVSGKGAKIAENACKGLELSSPATWEMQCAEEE